MRAVRVYLTSDTPNRAKKADVFSILAKLFSNNMGGLVVRQLLDQLEDMLCNSVGESILETRFRFHGFSLGGATRRDCDSENLSELMY